MQKKTSEPWHIICKYFIVRMLERENISKFSTVYLGRHHARRHGGHSGAVPPK